MKALALGVVVDAGANRKLVRCRFRILSPRLLADFAAKVLDVIGENSIVLR
jgi:hypothetical protein